MCGILAYLTMQAACAGFSDRIRGIIPSLERRGPDSQGWFNEGGCTMYSAVLHLRGLDRCDQPISDAAGNAFCWNGEVFGGNLCVPQGTSDTSVIFNALVSASTISADTGVKDVLSGVEGPFAFVFWHEASKTLWFGRDRLGRRSLLLRKPVDDDDIWALSSCIGEHAALQAIRSAGEVWEEVPPVGISYLRMRDSQPVEYQVVPWPSRARPLLRPAEWIEDHAKSVESSTTIELAASHLLELLDTSVRIRVESVCRIRSPTWNPDECDATSAKVGVMFSGGLDSTLLAALAHRHVDADDHIDLINVCFDPQEAPDRYTGVEALRELRQLFPSRQWNFICVDVNDTVLEPVQSHIYSLLYPRDTQMDLNIGTALWFGARGTGTMYNDPSTDTGEVLRPPEDGYEGNSSNASALQEQKSHWSVITGTPPTVQDPGSVETLSESGALPVQKLGECGDGQHAESVRQHVDAVAGSARVEDGATRQHDSKSDVQHGSAAGGRQAVGGTTPMRSELQAFARDVLEKFPHSSVKMVHQAILESRPDWIVGENRVRPIVSVLKKAGIGKIDKQVKQTDGEYVAGSSTDPRQWIRGRFGKKLASVLGTGKESESGCSVLLMGMGADEQLCGYSRYRTKLKEGGKVRVLQDMTGDMERIWKRNLGRDDRFLSDHGREARFPYLDENVVSYIAELPLDCIADLSLPPGIGDKLLLRKVAQMVGLKGASREVKRAIQFGTRVAKQSNKATFGSNRKATGDAKLQFV